MQNLDSLTGAVIYETERLTCRRWVPSDVDAIFMVYSDPESVRWVDDGTPITRDLCEAWLQVTANNYTNRGYGMFALDDRTSKKTVGFCGLVHPGGQPEVEIKYAFLKTHWGQGLASEAILEMVNFAAKQLSIQEIIATVAPQNIASQRVLLKTGFLFIEEKEDEDGDPCRYYRWSV